MNIETVTIEAQALHRILGAGSGDAALLYLYLRSGNPKANAQEIGLSGTRLSCAEATLRQLGLIREEESHRILAGERPSYTEKDVLRAVDDEPSFRSLYGEVQRLLGRNLNTEELKILLGFVRYLGLPEDVISVLVCYCKDRARQQGKLRNPSLRTIEKEAYAWAERGIDTLEEAAAFIQTQGIFDTESLERFLEAVEQAGIRVPIMAGIIPLKAAGMAKFMNQNVPGIAVPQDQIDRLAAAAEEGKEKGIKGLPGKLGMEMAAELIAEIKNENLCAGVHIMAIGAEKNVPVILEKAGL